MKRECTLCGNIFKYSPSQNRKYCSQYCYFESNKKDANGNWKGGFINDPWYNRWVMIKQRCFNPRCKDYHRYGGRGIKLLLTYSQLGELWSRDNALQMEQPTIDRIDNDGDYCYENCRFIENRVNSRRSAILHKRGIII